MIFKKAIVFLAPFCSLILLEILFFKIDWIYPILAISFFALLFLLGSLIKEKFFTRQFFYLSLTPLLLYYATIGFLLLLDSGILNHLIIFIFVIIFGVYLENLFLFYYYSVQYQSNSLGNLANFLALLIFFLTAVDLYSFYIFLNYDLWLLAIIFYLITYFLLAQVFWLDKISSKLKNIYMIILSLVYLEIFWCLAFLPTNFYVISIIITILFYASWGIFRAKLADKLDKKIFWRYIIICTALILLVIATSAWI